MDGWIFLFLCQDGVRRFVFIGAASMFNKNVRVVLKADEAQKTNV